MLTPCVILSRLIWLNYGIFNIFELSSNLHIHFTYIYLLQYYQVGVMDWFVLVVWFVVVLCCEPDGSCMNSLSFFGTFFFKTLIGTFFQSAFKPLNPALIFEINLKQG